jgi:hypothetical protein
MRDGSHALVLGFRDSIVPFAAFILQIQVVAPSLVAGENFSLDLLAGTLHIPELMRTF